MLCVDRKAGMRGRENGKNEGNDTGEGRIVLVQVRQPFICRREENVKAEI